MNEYTPDEFDSINRDLMEDDFDEKYSSKYKNEDLDDEVEFEDDEHQPSEEQEWHDFDPDC